MSLISVICHPFHRPSFSNCCKPSTTKELQQGIRYVSALKKSAPGLCQNAFTLYFSICFQVLVMDMYRFVYF